MILYSVFYLCFKDSSKPEFSLPDRVIVGSSQKKRVKRDSFKSDVQKTLTVPMYVQASALSPRNEEVFTIIPILLCIKQDRL